MLIFLAVAAAAFLWMAVRVSRTREDLPCGWWIAPSAICGAALIAAFALRVLA